MTTTRTTATDKQIAFALSLLGQKGFNTQFMDKHYSRLGAGMRERSGTVENWLRNQSRTDISALIDTVKGM